MTSQESLKHSLNLLRMERQADLEYYRQKVLLRSLHQRTSEGTTWYPVRLKNGYIGTGERLVVEVERTNHLEQPHAFQSGKSVSLFSNASGKPEREHANGVINYVRDNTMVITLQGEELPDWIDDGQLGVDVMFDEMTYREMEFALKEVMKADGNRVAELREILLGNTKPAAPAIGNLTNAVTILNSSQQEALQTVLITQDIAFIHGPPGTGKTTTLVGAIVQAVKEETQVLVTAPSNAAVDLLAEKLSDQGVAVLRIGHPARVTEQTLSKTLDARIAQHVHYHELRSLRKKMEQVKSMALKYKRQFGWAEKEQRRELLREAKSLKADADLLEFHIVNDLLQKSEAICCTLVGTSHPVLRGRKYKTAFIDEAGQALEPASWIPILRSARVIFAGDHHQLPPTIKSNEAARAGLSVTLFEKGIKRHPAKAKMLEVQYRMHEAIMKFPSDYFYKGGLIADPSVRQSLLNPNEPPIEFIDTAGCGYNELLDPETLSRSNEQEAHVVIRLAEKLVESIGLEAWIEQGLTMGIITPYRAQVDLLHKLAEMSHVLEPLHKLVTINTVDAFQGQERDVIVISFVRSNDKAEVGFLADIRRTNVAITRARKKLIMIGDSATLGSHPFYLELLDYVQKGESIAAPLSNSSTMFSESVVSFLSGLTQPRGLPKGIHVMNPYRDPVIQEICKAFYEKFYKDTRPRVLMLGINPGRFGSGTTGISFTDPIRLENACGIQNQLPKKPELSSDFIYRMIDAYGGPNKFYSRYFISAVSPLGFTSGGKNINYYDDKKLEKLIRHFAAKCIGQLVAMGIETAKCYSIGEGKNFDFLSKLNEEYRWFGEIIPLAHPRFIMQYRRKQLNGYIDQYLKHLS